LAHTTLTNVIVNGQTRTDCLRPTYNDQLYRTTGLGSTFPMSDENRFPQGIVGENYTCGWMPFAATAAAAKCSIAAGSTITVTHQNLPEANTIPYIAANHRGPFMAYMSKWDQTGGVPLDKTWFKVYQSGITQGNSDPNYIKWAAPDTLNANQGKISFQIPSDLAPGNYLLRTEILSFLSSSRNGAQGYIRCVELTVTGNGRGVPSGDDLAQLPGSVTYNDAGIRGIWWSDYATDYPFPGPKVYVAGSTPTTSEPTTETSQQTSQQTSKAPTTSSSAPVVSSAPTLDVEIQVLVTVTLAYAPSIVSVQDFANDVTGVLRLPLSAIENIQVDFDQSTASTTVVHFTLVNNPTTVDPIAAAEKLKEMASSNDPALKSTELLQNMQVNSVVQQDQQDSEAFVKSTTFVIIIAVAGSVVLIAAAVMVTIIVLRRRGKVTWF